MVYDSELNTITTERLVLRNIAESDLYDFYDFARDPEVGPRAGWQPHRSLDESRAFLSMFKKRPLYFAITVKGEDRMIGSIEAMGYGLENHGKVKEIGYVLCRREWGKGYMTEACQAMVDFCFEVLGCEKLLCESFEPNKASANVQRKCGFEEAGRTRMFTRWIDGEICDRIDRCLTLDSWKERSRR